MSQLENRLCQFRLAIVILYHWYQGIYPLIVIDQSHIYPAWHLMLNSGIAHHFWKSVFISPCHSRQSASFNLDTCSVGYYVPVTFALTVYNWHAMLRSTGIDNNTSVAERGNKHLCDNVCHVKHRVETWISKIMIDWLIFLWLFINYIDNI